MTTISDTREPGGPDDFLARVRREQARLTVSARERLTQVAMHDLRSPLNGIQGWVQVLESRLDTSAPLVQRALDGVRNCVVQQTQILDDTADIFRLMRADFEPGAAAADLEHVVEAAVAGAGAAALARQIEFSVHLEPGLRAAGEAQHLERALRYVLLYAVRCASAGDRLTVIVTEADAGTRVQIAPATQVASSQPAVHWGALPHPPLVWQLAQGLIEWHGGRLRAAMSSESGVPERFEVWLVPGGAGGAAQDAELRRSRVAQRLQLFAATLPTVCVIDGPGARRMADEVAATGADTHLTANAAALAGHLAAGRGCGALLLPASGEWDTVYADIPCLLYGAAAGGGALTRHVLGKVPDPCPPLQLAALIVAAADSVKPDSRVFLSK